MFRKTRKLRPAAGVSTAADTQACNLQTVAPNSQPRRNAGLFLQYIKLFRRLLCNVIHWNHGLESTKTNPSRERLAINPSPRNVRTRSNTGTRLAGNS